MRRFQTVAELRAWVGGLEPGDVDSAGPCGVVYLPFTDALYGPDVTVAAAVFEGLVAGLRRAGRRVVVTLHDVPQPADGGAFGRRSAGYRRVASAAGRVVVASRHEQDLLDRVAPGIRAEVIPLPIDARNRRGPVASRPDGGDRVAEIGVLGWVHPGKGHQAVIEAAAGLGVPVRVVALGAVPDHHSGLDATLADLAARREVPFDVTGWLDDADLSARMREVAVPVCAHRNISASASIASWIEAGRRPLVAASPYTAELEERCPGAVWLYDADSVGGTRGRPSLRTALRSALTGEEPTWCRGPVGPGLSEVARRYRHLLVATGPEREADR